MVNIDSVQGPIMPQSGNPAETMSSINRTGTNEIESAIKIGIRIRIKTMTMIVIQTKIEIGIKIKNLPLYAEATV